MYTSTVFSNTFKSVLIALLTLGIPTFASAQIPAGGANGGRPGFNAAQMNIGRFYGKVIDDNTGKGIGYASVQLIGMRFDSTSRTMKPAVIAGQLTEENGEFSLENLPVMGEFTLKIAILGYDAFEKKVSFGIKMGPGARPDASMVDKDLGNIRIATSSEMLKEVTVDAEASGVGLALDKKIFKVDRNNLAAGGTAEDALRTVPSLTVDIDGNLTLRNAAPQLFVDGRPTALTLDQIPADAIDNVEIITNPSAKYDAGGGNAGIVNVVLKKNRRVGYNGSVRAGVDMRGRGNLGGDINARDRKINAFLSGNANLRRSITNGETDRINLFGNPRTEIFQETRSTTDRFFINGRTGFDWFVNNRNTITLAANYTQGQFNPNDRQNIHTDTFAQGIFGGASDAVRSSETSRGFRNLGGQLLFKHLFPTDGMEWTADINYNGSRNETDGTFITDYADDQLDGRQQQTGQGGNDFVTAQTDFVMPLKKGLKVEAGARAAIRNFRTENANFQYDYLLNEYVQVVNFADRYRYNDQVYALYGTFSQSFKKWGYQVGLRVESSQYTGELPANGQVFENDYPFTPFPSVFLTYKLNEEDNVQLNYSRRINRPGFFQLIPFPDFSDSLLLSRGNPDLLPEFTNSLEFSYQNIFNKRHNVLFTAYFKQATDLITRYQFTEFNEFLGRDAVVSSFANANSSIAYGAEITFKNTLGKNLEVTSNLNAYNSIVDASNVESNLENEQFTWFIKENISWKLPKQFTFQINGEYQSRTAFAASTGGGGRWGGGGHGGWGGTSNTAQGYTRPVWFVDLSVRKDLWQRKASVTLAFEDIFRSRRNGSFTGSSFFTQDTWRLRDPQFVRLNFSYRFGKFDVSLFKRKNTKVSTEGMEGMF